MRENGNKEKVCHKNAKTLTASLKKDCKVETMDETEYLLRSPANRKAIFESMEQIKQGKVKDFRRVDC